MKNLKKPTYSQRKRIEAVNIDPKKVLVERDTGTAMIVVDRESNKSIEICTHK